MTRRAAAAISCLLLLSTGASGRAAPAEGEWPAWRGPRRGCRLLAYDAGGGKELWAAPNGPVYPDPRGGGPRGAPTVDGDLVYAVSGTGRLACAEAGTGKVYCYDIRAEGKPAQ